MRSLLAILLTLALGMVHAEQTVATRADGTQVLLKADGTWEELSVAEDDAAIAEAPPIAPRAAEIDLSLEHLNSSSGYCRVGLRLDNRANYTVEDIVFQISAYQAGDTMIETVFAGFLSVRPSQHKSKTFEFRAAPCNGIAYLAVHGGDRCRMDNLSKYSSEKGECLARVNVVPGGEISLRKLEPSE